jgi:hypothetical protein
MKPKAPEYKIKICPDIIFGKLIEGPELVTYESQVAQHLKEQAGKKKQPEPMRGSATTMTALRASI